MNDSTKKRKWQQLDYRKRLKIELLHKEGKTPQEIAAILGYSRRTLERELSRGMTTVRHVKYDPFASVIPIKRAYKETVVYSADVARKAADEAASRKGKQLKIGGNHDFAEYIEEKIGVKKLSPYAALELAKRENKPFAGLVCVKTLYNYIDSEVFLNISNKDLWIKKNPKKRHYGHVRPAYNNLKGRSIEERPKEVLERSEQGHWEMDTVVGAGKTCLLVITERKTRQEIIRKLSNRSQLEVKRVLDTIERRLGARKFRKTFKSITMDNGSEFLSQTVIETSCINKNALRTTAYYCHPYSSWERGSNENANRLIRRFIPKGSNLADYSKKEIQRIENYINNYPRRLFEGYPSNSLYQIPAYP